MSTELSRTSNEIEVFKNDKLKIFQGTPLSGASQLYEYAIRRSCLKNRPLINSFFSGVCDLYESYIIVMQNNQELQQKLDRLSNVSVPNDPISVNDPQQNTSFRDFLLQHSESPEVQEVLKNIVDYNKSTVNPFIKDRSTEPDWEAFVDELMDIKRNALNSTRTYQSRVSKFIQQACDENYALRSKNIEEVVQNIIRARELVNTN